MKFNIFVATLCGALFPLVAQAQDLIRPVKLITVAPTEAALERRFFGQIVARQTVDLAFQVSGQIESFPIIEGNDIAKGDLIAQLDLVPFELAHNQAQVQLDQARRDVERLDTLGRNNTVSQVTIDDAHTALRLSEISLKTTDTALEHATLMAPFDGIVATRNVANFTTVAAGTPVARLHDMSELRVDIDVPEVLFTRARDGEDVEIYATLPGSDVQFPLELREFNAETSSVGQTYTLTLGMTPPEEPQLLPGASVTVVASQKLPDQQILLPSQAVQIGPDGSTYVYVFTPTGADEGTLTKTKVALNADDRGFLALIGGVDPDAEIVAAGLSSLSDGQTVRRFAGFNN